MVYEVNLVNDSSFNIDLQQLASVLQKQLDEHYTPVWNIGAKIEPEVSNSDMDLILKNNTDVVGALGYHVYEGYNKPTALVFVVTSIDDGFPFSAVASHELLEMLTNPFVNLFVDASANDSGIFFTKFIFREICDAVEEYTYQIDNIQVSDFVTPYWFYQSESGNKYDYLGKLTSPLSIGQGGYYSYYMCYIGSGYQEYYDKKAKPRPHRICKH